MEEYLRELYPKASKRKIRHFVSLVEEGDAEKLPPTKEMLRYETLKKRAELIKDEMDALKLVIIEQKERTGHAFQGFHIQKISTRTFLPDNFYRWVADTVSEATLEELTIRTIDESKFKKMEAKGLIEYDELPDDIFKPGSHYRISSK